METNGPDERFVHDLLFGNNRTGRTYHAEYFGPPTVRIADRCAPMTSDDDGDVAFRTRLYREQGVSAAFTSDNAPYLVGDEIASIVSGVTLEVPRYSPLQGLPKQRRKSGDGNVVCIPTTPVNAKYGRPLTFHLLRDRAAFDALWRRPQPALGYRSPSRRETPGCYVEVRAAPTNEVMATDVHVLMPDWELATFRSRPFLGCLVRGALAAFGLPGVLAKPDGLPLTPRLEQAFAQDGDKRDSRLIAAAQLYDGPGATWPEVRAEWRRLRSKPAYEREPS